MSKKQVHVVSLIAGAALVLACMAGSLIYGRSDGGLELRVAQAASPAVGGPPAGATSEDEGEEGGMAPAGAPPGAGAAPGAGAVPGGLMVGGTPPGPFYPGLETPGGVPVWSWTEEDQRRYQWSREVSARWEAIEEYQDRMLGVSDGTTTRMLGWPQAVVRWSQLYGWYGRHVDAQTRAAMHDLIDPIADEVAWANRGNWSPVPTATLVSLYGGGGLGSSVVIGPDQPSSGAAATAGGEGEEGGATQTSATETVSQAPAQATSAEEGEEGGETTAEGGTAAAAPAGGVVAAAGSAQDALRVREMYSISRTGGTARDGKVIPFCGPPSGTVGYVDKDGQYVLQTSLASLQEMVRRGVKRKIRLALRADALASAKNIPKDVDAKLWECARAATARETRLNPVTDPVRWAQRVKEEYEDLVVLYKYGVQACPWFDGKSRPRVVQLGG